MINVYNVSKYCKDEMSLIENYEEAVNSPETWQCHHRLETDLNMTQQDLIDNDLYFNRPASELIFLTKAEHTSLHSVGKNFMDKMTSEAIGQWCKNISISHKGQDPWNTGLPKEQQPMYNKDPWNKGLKGIKTSSKGQKAHNKGKKRFTREDGTHYYA